MSNGYPCPNPACTHVFAPDSIKGVAAVSCPLCGTVFQFRNVATAPKKPAPFPPPSLPAASVPPPPPPPHRPAPPPVPRTLQVEPVAPRSVASNLAFDAPTSTPSARTKKKRRRGNGSKYVAAAVFLLLIGGAVGAFFYFRDSIPWGDDDDQRKRTQAKGNFSITVPAAWKGDDLLATKFRASFARTRAKPAGHFVLRYRDYERRLPSDAELFDDALKRLKAYFPQVEYINPFEQENKGRNGTLGGESALVFTFSAADANQVPMRGECHTFARQGYAYWLFFWGPEDSQESLVDQFAGLRERFKLYNDREGWKPRPRDSELVRGATVAFQADAAKEVWKNETNAKDADPAAEMLLRGYDPIEDEGTGRTRVVPLAGKSAEILVLVLPATPDLPGAMKSAKEYIQKQAAESNPEAKLEPAVDPASGKEVAGKDVGQFPGRVEQFRLVLGPDTERFALVGVARRPEGVLVVYGKCNWDRRGYWAQEFKAFLETVRSAPKGARP